MNLKNIIQTRCKNCGLHQGKVTKIVFVFDRAIYVCPVCLYSWVSDFEHKIQDGPKKA